METYNANEKDIVCSEEPDKECYLRWLYVRKLVMQMKKISFAAKRRRGDHLGTSRNFLALLGPSWVHLEPCSAFFGHSWNQLCKNERLASMGAPCFNHVGSLLESLRALGRSWGLLGAIVVLLGALLAPTWGHLGQCWLPTWNQDAPPKKNIKK